MLTREQKVRIVEQLVERIKSSSVIYLLDYMGLDTPSLNQLRSRLKEKDMKFQVVKNTLMRIALEQALNGEAKPLIQHLVGPTSVIFSTHPAEPARIIQQIREELGVEKPVLKVAWIEGAIFEGDDALKQLRSLKSREELIADVLVLLQAPVQQVLMALRSPLSQVLQGIRHYLEQKENNSG